MLAFGHQEGQNMTGMDCTITIITLIHSSLPERSRDGVLELEPAGLAVDLERHDVDGGVVELDPGELAAVGAEPEGARVRDHLLLVHPVRDPVEDGAGDA